MNDFQDRDRGPVQQVVYRWDGNHGRQGTGMNAVAHSCDAERAEELGRELGPLLWVSGAAAARPSVVRTLSRDGDVLLVQRWPEEEPEDFNRTQIENRTYWATRHKGFGVASWKSPDDKLVISVVTQESKAVTLQIAGKLRDELDPQIPQKKGVAFVTE